MKFALIDVEKAIFTVAALCHCLGVSRAGYYAWRGRSPSQHARTDDALRVKIRESHDISRRTYGSPRVQEDLAAKGIHVSRKRVVRLMQEEELIARTKRRFKCTTVCDPTLPVAPNLLQQEFHAEAPNQRWVADTTELYLGLFNTKLYLAVVLDLFSRMVVGWAISRTNDRHLAISALEMAVRQRCPEGDLLYHSDQGSPYASEDHQDLLVANGIICSMSGQGNCYDNAAMESWFSTLKFELGEKFANEAKAKAQLFDYIEVFYNQQRRHSTLGYVSPAQFERVAKLAA